jgi:anti-sigma B factor antagonist
MQQSALSPDFFCDVRPERDRVIVRVVGELDLAAAPDVGITIRELLGAGFTSIVVDLRELTFLDSAGVHMLVAAERSVAGHDGTLSLMPGPRSVQRVFELTGTDTLFALGAGLPR